MVLSVGTSLQTQAGPKGGTCEGFQSFLLGILLNLKEIVPCST